MNNRNKIFLLFVLIVTLMFLPACVPSEKPVLPQVSDYEFQESAQERKNLKLGIVAGPYGDLFLETIYPFLREKGYTVEIISYGDYVSPNVALAGKMIDLNLSQHYRYLNNYNFANDVSLSAIAEVPTVSMGIYSLKYNSLYNLKKGLKVFVPSDGINFSRALLLLEAANLIKLNPNINKYKATSNSIMENPYQMEFVPTSPNLLAASLPDADLAVINGNYAFSSGLKSSAALYNERQAEDYFNIIVVRTEDLGEQFVKDIVAVTRLDDYKYTIRNSKYMEFQLPRDFFSTR
ncbi:MAG: hypothetical protein LBR56_09035 [Sporomusaceae bacterium]|jgi:D-methionine transport system substrate-binding protein|nr:hypothetical protein [Sporomusaceae bacterium]